MKPNLLLIILFLLLPCISSAKKLPPVEMWNNGILVLNNNEVIKGKIFYHAEHDLVQIMQGAQIKTFSPYNVHYFQYYDETREIKRLYASLEEKNEKRQRKAATFFEVLLGDNMVLLRKEEHHYIPDFEILYNAIDLIPSMASRHYVLVNNKLISFQDFQQDIMPLMKDYQHEISEYIKTNKLALHDFVSQILIIDYYNYLKDPNYIRLDHQMLAKE